MLIIKAKVCIPYVEGTFGKKMWNCFRCTILTKGNGFISETCVENVGDLVFNREFIAYIKIPYGECYIKDFMPNSNFQYYLIKPFGNGKVQEIKEVIFEKDIMEECDEENLKFLFEYLDANPSVKVSY